MTPSPATSAESGGFEGLSSGDAISQILDTPDTSAPEQPGGEAAPPEQVAPELDPLDFGDEEETPEQVQDNGRNAYKMSEAHMQRLTAAKDFLAKVQEFAPTPEAAQEHFQRASDFHAMESDFASADPANVGEFLNYWNQQSPEAMGVMAQQLPAFLEKTGNHQVLRAIEGQVYGATVNRLYTQAQQAVQQFGEGSAAAKQALYKAQALDYAINGKHKGLDALPKVDPNARTQQTQQQREQAINKRETDFINNQWQSWDKAYVSGAKETALTGALDKILNDPRIKDAYTPGILNSIRQTATNEIQQKLAADLEWNRNHSIEQRNIQRDFLSSMRKNERTDFQPRIQAHVGDYANRISRVLPSVLKPLIQGATKNAVDANGALHQRLAAGAARSAPNGSGVPARRSIAPVPGNWKSAREGLDALLDS